jgi:gas vesicle protein
MTDTLETSRVEPVAADDGVPGFLTGLLLGGLIGVTVAMIVAPRAGGDEARDLLGAKAREASASVREAAGDLSKSAQTAAGEVTTSATDLIARGKQIVEDARARFDLAVADGKDAAAQQRSILESET